MITTTALTHTKHQDLDCHARMTFCKLRAWSCAESIKSRDKLNCTHFSGFPPNLCQIRIALAEKQVTTCPCRCSKSCATRPTKIVSTLLLRHQPSKKPPSRGRGWYALLVPHQKDGRVAWEFRSHHSSNDKSLLLPCWDWLA